MAGSADIYVAFGADTGGLEAALARANANVRALTRELNGVAKEMQTAGAAADSQLGMKLKSLGGDLATAKERAGGISDQMHKLAGGMEHTATAGAHGGTGLGFYVRELHALMDEFGSGRDRQALGTMSNLVMTFLQANLSLIPLAAGIAAVGGGFAYFAYQAYTAGQAVKSIELDAVVAQFRLTDSESKQLIDRIKQLANVGNSDAAAIAKPFLALGPGGDIVAKLVATYLPMLSKAMGEDAPKAAEKLSEMFANLSTKGRAYIAETHGTTSAQMEAYDAFVASGRTGEAYAAILEAMRIRLASYSEELDRKKAQELDDAVAAQQLAATTEAFGAVMIDTGHRVEDLNTKLAAQAVAAQADAAALREATDAQKTFVAGMEAALKIDKVTADIRETTAQIDRMKAALAHVPAGDAGGADELARGIAMAEDKLTELQQKAADGLLGRDALARTREQIADYDATFRGSTVARLEGERTILQSLLATERLTATERHQIEQDLQAKTREIQNAANHAYEAQMDIRVAAAALDKAKVVALREEEVRREIEIYGAGSDQAIAAERKLAAAKEQAAKQGSKATDTAAKDQLTATQESIRGQIAEVERATQVEVEHYALQVKLKQITEGQKLALSEAAYAREKTSVEAMFARELALAGLTAAKRQEILNQQLAFTDKVTEQIFTVEKQAAEKTEAAWDNAMKSINGAFDSQISGLVSGTTSWGNAARSVLRSLTVDVIRFFVNWGLEQAENTAKAIVLDNSRVTAHLAGQTAIVAADSATNDAGIVSMIANALKGIMTDAGQVAAGVTAFLAPTMGPAAIPAGAAAGGAVAAFAGATFATGAWSIPGDMIAGLHRGEMVVPSRGGIADEFRSFMSGGGFGRGGASAPGGGNTHHWDFRGSNVGDQTALVRKIVAALNANPTLRPSY